MPAQNVAGTWQGTATLGKDQSRIVVKLAENGGQLSGALYTIDEDDGGDPIALSSVSRDGETLKFAVAVIDIAFSGRFSPDGNSIAAGTFTVDETHAPLTFVRANADTAWDIPKPTEQMARNADPPSRSLPSSPPSRKKKAQASTPKITASQPSPPRWTS